MQDYSASSAYSWNTVGMALGSYGLEVDVRDQGATAAYERVGNLSYSLAVTPCTTPALASSPVLHAATAATVTFSATTAGCAAPNYRFWVGQNGAWKIVQDYAASSTFTWNTATYAAGAYGIEVDVRDAKSIAAYDHVANLTYTLSGCSAARLSTNGASPQAPGPIVTLTGAATCPGTAEYRFWTRQNGMWKIAQDFSPSSTFGWNTSGLTQGTYGLEVDARDVGETAAFESVANVTFTLYIAPCAAALLVTNLPSPQIHGVAITLSGSAACVGAPEYRFWVRRNGVWTIVRDFSPSSTFIWDTTNLAPGTYGLEVDVRNQSSTAAYETVSNLTFAMS